MRRSWIAIAMSLGLAGCGDEPRTGVPAICELVVDTPSECPSVGTICTGHCGAVHDCCYPIGEVWGDLITDCEPCHDAGPAMPSR